MRVRVPQVRHRLGAALALVLLSTAMLPTAGTRAHALDQTRRSIATMLPATGATALATAAAAANAGTITSTFRTGAMGLLWRSVPAARPVLAAPAAGPDGIVYAADGNGLLYARAPDGRLRWTMRTAITAPLAPAAVGPDGTSYWSLPNAVIAVSARGALRWTFLVLGAGAPVLDRSRLLVATPAYLEAIGLSGGQAGHLLWRAAIGGGGSASAGPAPAVAPNGTAYVATASGDLDAIGSNGLRRWRVRVARPLHFRPAVGPDGTVYLDAFANGRGTLFALTPQGHLRWQRAVPAGSDVAVSPGGTVYVAARQLVALAPNGQVRWQRLVDATAPPVVVGAGVAVAALTPPRLLTFDAQGAISSQATLPMPLIGPPAPGPSGRLYGADAAGTILALSPLARGRGRLLPATAPSGPVVNPGADNPPFQVRHGALTWRVTLAQTVQRRVGNGPWQTVLTPGRSTLDPRTGRTIPARYATVSFLLLDPHAPGLYVGTVGVLGNYLTGGQGSAAGGLYYSADGVGNWQARTQGLPFTFEPRLHLPTYGLASMVVDPAQRGMLYAQTLVSFGSPGYDAGLYRSTDGGQHWTQATRGLPYVSEGNTLLGYYRAHPPGELLLDPARPWILFLVAPTGLYRSPDRGIHWGLVRQVAYSDPTTIAVRIAGKGVVRVFTDLGTYLSTDFGSHWRRVQSAQARTLQLAVSGAQFYAPSSPATATVAPAHAGTPRLSGPAVSGASAAASSPAGAMTMGAPAALGPRVTDLTATATATQTATVSATATVSPTLTAMPALSPTASSTVTVTASATPTATAVTTATPSITATSVTTPSATVTVAATPSPTVLPPTPTAGTPSPTNTSAPPPPSPTASNTPLPSPTPTTTPLPVTTVLPPAWRWTQLMPNGTVGSPPRRQDATTVWDPVDRQLLLYGGTNARSSQAMGDLWAYSPATGAWRRLTASNATPSGRFGAAGVWDANGRRLVIFGGQQSGGPQPVLLDDVEAYSPSSNTWTTLSPQGAHGAPTPRSHLGAAWDSRQGRLLLFGGETSASLALSSQLWAFTPGAPGTWELLSPGGRRGQPGPRNWPAMVWDPLAHLLRLFGGKNAAGSSLGDMWQWTETSGWSFTETRAQPTGRSAAAAAWDVQHAHYLVGPGLGLNGDTNDLWAFDPAARTWKRQSIAGSAAPQPRQMSGLAWDDADGQGFLFGGRVAGPGPANDLWALQPAAPTGPPPALPWQPVRQAVDVGLVVNSDGTLNVTPREVQAVVDAGATMVRFSFGLGNNSSWSPALLRAYGHAITMFQNAGVGVIGLVSAGATTDTVQADWAANSYENTGGSGDNPFISALYSADLRLLVRYFHGPPYNVKMWELWNEPNAYTTCNGGICGGASYLNPSNFAALLADAYQGVKVTDHIDDVTLLSGGLFGHSIGGVYSAASAGANYLTDTYHIGVDVVGSWTAIKAHTGSYPLDAVGQHIYIDQSSYTATSTIQAYEEWVRHAYAAYEGATTSKPTIITEEGWATGSDPGISAVTLDQQLNNVDAAYWAAKTVTYVPLLTWFRLRDNPAAHLYQGLYTPTWAPKPARARYQSQREWRRVQ